MGSDKYKNVLEKFSRSFEIFGVYIHQQGRLIPILEKNPKGMVILRANLNELDSEGTYQFHSFNVETSAVISTLPKKELQLILLVETKKIDRVSRHWQRIHPVLLKTIPLNEIVEEESPTTRIVRLTAKIGDNLEDIHHLLTTKAE